MHSTHRVILLELNELTPALMDRFIAEGNLPNFRRFHEEALVFTTDAAERPPFLEPWIQWVTVHSGLDYAEHGVFHLNEGHKLAAKRVWDIVSDAGFPVWVCGSMNVRYEPNLNGCVLPDPWCTLVEARPRALQPFFRFIQKSVLEYSNDAFHFSLKDYASFVAFLVSHGLSLETAKSAVGQLISERDGRNRWKRSAILDKFLFDVFRWYYLTTRPRFSTFFLNSTAHHQHSYWRNLEPELFTIKPTEKEQSEYGSAILFAYQAMDDLLGRFMDLAGDEATLVFCTALSQQPCLKYESSGGATFYRPQDFAAVARFADITHPFHAAPVMTHQFNVDFETEEAARDAEQKLKALRIPSGPALEVNRTGARIFTGCQVYSKIPAEARLTVEPAARSVPFFDLFYQLESMKSGMHHPDGMLWIRTPLREHAVLPGKVPLTAVAPTLLNLLDLSPPTSMRSDPLRLHPGSSAESSTWLPRDPDARHSNVSSP